MKWKFSKLHCSNAIHNIYRSIFKKYYGIDVEIEISPVKSMQSAMSTGIAHYEGEVYNVLRHGRNNPPVPLIIIGIAP